MLAGHAGKYSRYEFERKFLLTKLPPAVGAEFIDIHDTYLPNSSLRLRIEVTPSGEIKQRKLTKKDKAKEKGPNACTITSLYLSEEDAKALEPLKGFELKKRRYALEDEKNRIVFDVFQGPHEGLILAEIEFLDPESCASFKPYDTSWKDVTEDPTYSGGSLAARGNLL